jgi:hypothetical protein
MAVLKYRRGSIPNALRASAMQAASQVGFDQFEEIFLDGRILKVRRVHADSVRAHFSEFLEPPCNFNLEEIVRVDWQTWAIPKAFTSEFEGAVIERVESIVVAAETLLDGEIFTYGLGPEYNWLHWEEGRPRGAALPNRVFTAIRDLIEGDWRDFVSEHAEGDDTYLEGVHPRLRAAVKRVLQKEI